MADFGQSKLSIILAYFTILFGRVIDIQNYSDRLILQKFTYILTLIDSRVDYKFSWYIRGPYSSELTKDAFSITSTDSTYHMRPKDFDNLELIKSLLDNLDETNFELYASILYHIKDVKNFDEQEVAFTISSLKPWFTTQQIHSAIQKIKNSDFLINQNTSS